MEAKAAPTYSDNEGLLRFLKILPDALSFSAHTCSVGAVPRPLPYLLHLPRANLETHCHLSGSQFYLDLVTCGPDSRFSRCGVHSFPLLHLLAFFLPLFVLNWLLRTVGAHTRQSGSAHAGAGPSQSSSPACGTLTLCLPSLGSHSNKAPCCTSRRGLGHSSCRPGALAPKCGRQIVLAQVA